MYILAHLAAGLALGLFAAWFFHDQRWVIPCSLGGILPDLIDKPLGYIKFSIGYGRIYCHTLLLVLVLFACGALWWNYRKSPVVLALALGVLSHQILDAMWEEPKNWLYPFLGPFQSSIPSADFFWNEFVGEITSPMEWLMGVVLVLMVLLLLKRNWVMRMVRIHGQAVKILILISLLAISAIGISAVWSGLTGSVSPVTQWGDPTNNVISGLVIIGAAGLLWVWWSLAAVSGAE